MGLIDIDKILKEEIGKEEELDKRLIERTREVLYYRHDSRWVLVLIFLASIFISVEIILCAAAFKIGIALGLIIYFIFTIFLEANIILIYFYKDDILNYIYLGGK